MAEFSYGPNGQLIMHARYSRNGVLNMTSIFPYSKKTTKLLKASRPIVLHKHYNVARNEDIVKRVFFKFIMLVLTRVADGDVFLFPGKTGANISLQKMRDESVRRARQDGKFQDIDLTKSGFVIPEFVFDFGPKYTRRNRRIYVPKHLEQRAFRNAENRTIPWTKFRKNIGKDDSDD